MCLTLVSLDKESSYCCFPTMAHRRWRSLFIDNSSTGGSTQSRLITHFSFDFALVLPFYIHVFGSILDAQRYLDVRQLLLLLLPPLLPSLSLSSSPSFIYVHCPSHRCQVLLNMLRTKYLVNAITTTFGDWEKIQETNSRGKCIDKRKISLCCHYLPWPSELDTYTNGCS